MSVKIKIALACIAVTCGAAVSASDLDSLLSRSPFLPAGYNDGREDNKPEEKKREQPQNWTLRGWTSFGDVTRVSLYDKSENKGYWIGLNDPKAPVRILNLDKDSRKVIVSIDGRSTTIELEKSTFASTSEAPAARPAARPKPAEPNANANQGDNRETQRRIIPRRRVIVPRRTN
ncbi:MAG: hypothetical protein AAGB06_03170 [Verrucomicrobiota bacterium]